MQLYASDGTYTDDESFTWNIGVNTTITITDPGDQSNNEWDSVDLPIEVTDSLSNPNANYTVSNLPTGLSWTPNSDGVIITGNLTIGGSWQPTITDTDRAGNTATDTFNWYVSSPITITDSGDQAYNIGDAVSVPITATDTDSAL